MKTEFRALCLSAPIMLWLAMAAGCGSTSSGHLSAQTATTTAHTADASSRAGSESYLDRHRQNLKPLGSAGVTAASARPDQW